jgi:predicted NAD-dependent protein-ADP-ribosyltransferase YbiA (DUF1768 family)
MTVKNYDPASYELAEHFLQDEKALVANVQDDPARAVEKAAEHSKNCDRLARHIQDAVEDWFFMREHGLIK